jgi:hypothetical protein
MQIRNEGNKEFDYLLFLSRFSLTDYNYCFI